MNIWGMMREVAIVRVLGDGRRKNFCDALDEAARCLRRIAKLRRYCS